MRFKDHNQNDEINHYKDLTSKLLATFRLEAEEHLLAMSSGLMELGKPGASQLQAEIIECIFREAHSLKGAARAVHAAEIEAACHSIEGTFAALKSGTLTLSSSLLDELHQRVDDIKAQMVKGHKDGPTIAGSSSVPDAARQQIRGPGEIFSADSKDHRQVSHEDSHRSAKAPSIRHAPGLTPGRPETFRVPVRRVDSLLRQAEELVPSKAAAHDRLTESRAVVSALMAWEAESRKCQARVPAALAAGENRNAEELKKSQGALKLLRQKLRALTKHLESDHHVLERKIDDLVEDAKWISMLPFSTLLESFPTLVRDLCRDCGKDAELAIMGGEIEADRRMLEEIKDPLTHLLRNCIDHGVESPVKRSDQGKPPRATVCISISLKTSDKVEIVVSDDGAGIDLQKVRAAAIKLGIVSPEEARNLDDRSACALIFKSGVSTSPMITEVSGRGLGLAIVREKAEKVGGTVEAETLTGGGTAFRLLLPMAVARFRGIFVRVGEAHFVLPTRYVEKVLQVAASEIKNVENRKTICYQQRVLPAVSLGDVLKLPQLRAERGRQNRFPIVVAVWNGLQVAFFVDEVLSEQEVLVKPLGRQLAYVRNIAGATVLGNGKVVPVLDVAELIDSAFTLSPVSGLDAEEEAPRSILLAEDSITARTLMKNVLEFAGYRVKTAVNGADAWSLLAEESFDLVVSDVEMPRMSGFDLTGRIRNDPRTTLLPVILVTALDSQADRERGVDVGANAYVVKSSFDEGNLLEVVRRLV